jgi:hypothetical protein
MYALYGLGVLIAAALVACGVSFIVWAIRGDLPDDPPRLPVAIIGGFVTIFAMAAAIAGLLWLLGWAVVSITGWPA